MKSRYNPAQVATEKHSSLLILFLYLFVCLFVHGTSQVPLSNPTLSYMEEVQRKQDPSTLKNPHKILPLQIQLPGYVSFVISIAVVTTAMGRGRDGVTWPLTYVTVRPCVCVFVHKRETEEFKYTYMADMNTTFVTNGVCFRLLTLQRGTKQIYMRVCFRFTLSSFFFFLLFH